MLPILQLSPPILKAPSLPSVFSRCISLPNSSSVCTCPLLSVVWYVSFLQVSCSCILWRCPASSAFLNYFGCMIHFLKFSFKPWLPHNIFLNEPVPVATRFKVQVYSPSSAETVGSCPTRCIDVCRECCVLSGRGLCDELITHPE